eukprot:TRINITY_DN3621_c0_g1_i1.p1 TRINITY_DN3621_c0_g1~~TRINITY_DN3621_c0_g1_i1.p1  ORF type:complete len:296 (+),score=6.24 TRINITY_DN3621_c0_g1_i1:66-890(+)
MGFGILHLTPNHILQATIITRSSPLQVVGTPISHFVSGNIRLATSVRESPRRTMVSERSGHQHSNTERWLLSVVPLAAVFLAAFLLTALPGEVWAFENRTPESMKWLKEPKTAGARPADLGLLPRRDLGGALGLKTCRGPPNCFSTSGLFEDQLVSPWLPPPSLSAEEAIQQVVETIRAYPPGRQGHRRRGFAVITASPTYVYAQFESARHGYIDDVEFVSDPSGPDVLLRSSSRIGYLDLGVNAKRLNWLAAALVAKGWTAPPITAATHLSYF